MRERIDDPEELKRLTITRHLELNGAHSLAKPTTVIELRNKHKDHYL